MSIEQEPQNPMESKTEHNDGPPSASLGGSANRANPYEVLGWAYSYCCNLLDKDEDLRDVPVPTIISDFERDFNSPNEKLSGR